MHVYEVCYCECEVLLLIIDKYLFKSLDCTLIVKEDAMLLRFTDLVYKACELATRDLSLALVQIVSEVSLAVRMHSLEIILLQHADIPQFEIAIEHRYDI